ncbi:MAG: hypothetical protein DI535_03570 [Citrobacter freundii]|nr:MAG: hypothetical protein DI535_03570 [Citrobacter freundii]
MRVIDRLNEYLEYKQITPYKFEKTLEIANGYLSKQLKGRGSIGSNILIRILYKYPDLDFIWLLTGNGSMISFSSVFGSNKSIPDEFHSPAGLRYLLDQHFTLLEIALSDKIECLKMLNTLDIP